MCWCEMHGEDVTQLCYSKRPWAERTQKAKHTLLTKYGLCEEYNHFLKLLLDLHGYIS